MDQIIIIGAGITGLSLAWELCASGCDYRISILESEREVGGLARTIHEGIYYMDVGPHIFYSDDKHIIDSVFNLFPEEPEAIPRRAQFYYQGRYIDYPVDISKLLTQIKISTGIRAGLSFLKGMSTRWVGGNNKRENESVEEWGIRNFGKYLYHSFFKPYIEQFWGQPGSLLSREVMPFCEGINLYNTLRSFFDQNVPKDGNTLIERDKLISYYPKSGFGEIVELIAAVLRSSGVNINLDNRVQEIEELPDGRVCVICDRNGCRREFVGDHVISTIPLNQFIQALKPSVPSEVSLAAEALHYRSLLVLGMVTKKANILGCNYMYILDRLYKRISEMNTFSEDTSPAGENILLAEIPCSENSDLWRASKEELFELCIKTLAEDGILERADVTHLIIVKEPNAYPVRCRNCSVHLSRLRNYLSKRTNLSILGRTGEFLYLDVDECMKRAFGFAKSLLTANST